MKIRYTHTIEKALPIDGKLLIMTQGGEYDIPENLALAAIRRGLAENATTQATEAAAQSADYTARPENWRRRRR